MLGSKESLQKAFTPEILAEVLWELRETKFQIELLVLDQVLAFQNGGVQNNGAANGDVLVQLCLQHKMNVHCVLHDSLGSRFWSFSSQ